MDIATGRPEDHPTLRPVDTSTSPTLAPVTAVAGQVADQGGVMDATAMFADQAQAGEADARAAQAAAMTAEDDRRSGYHVDMLPLGADYGDAMSLPDVPANAVPPASSALYPWNGDEPVA